MTKFFSCGDICNEDNVGVLSSAKFLIPSLSCSRLIFQLNICCLLLVQFRDDGSDKMVEFLRSSVGIIHKHHAASITNYIRDKVEAELVPKDDGPRPKKRLTFCVEGNISVGKSTFLQKIASETLELQDLVEVLSLYPSFGV